MPDDDRYVLLMVIAEGDGLAADVMPFDGGRGGPVRRVGLDRETDVPGDLPCVVVLVMVDDVAVIEPLVAIDRATVAVAGNILTLKVGGDAPRVVTVDAADVGLVGDRAGAVQALPAASVLGLAGNTEWVCTHPGGIDGWFTDWQTTRRRRRRRQRLAKQRERFGLDAADADSVFVNPYTFVPLPETVTRGKPRGHACLGPDGLSGWFDVTWRFDADYLLPQDHPDVTELPAVLRIPGSTVKGAVRAIHEVLTDGCLRIFDADYLPVHRETTVQHGGWTLAVVAEVDPMTGAPLTVKPCDRVVWVSATRVHTVVPDTQLRSGSTLDIAVGDANVMPSGVPDPLESHLINDPGGRRRLVESTHLTAGSRWVLHVTDANARLTGKPYYVAAGLRGDQVRYVSSDAWQLFQRVCRGSVDGPAPQSSVDDAALDVGPKHPDWPGAEVKFESKLIGRRRRADGWLGVGDTVWVNAGTGPVGELKLALMWRAEGKYRAGERVGDVAAADNGQPDSSPLPCTHPDWLCPTCAVFGSADVSGGREKAEQRSYAAHLRFGSLRSIDPETGAEVAVTSTSIELPPLSSPKPSSGMFYLSHAGVDGKQFEVERGEQPRSFWGSELDPGRSPRRLAGRKFYWHGVSPQQDHPRHERRFGNAENQCRTGQVIKKGTVCRGRVWFDNLDEAQLGLLLGAVEPGCVLADLDAGHTDEGGDPVVDGRTFATHLGGGKPIGLGTVVPTIDRDSLVARGGASRYQAAPAPPIDVDAVTKAAQVRRYGGHPDDAPETWYALASVLAEGRVRADRIWYPPAARWSERVDSGEGPASFNPVFDESYFFFQTYRGGGLGAVEPMLPLPAAVRVDQALPIAVKGEE